MAYSNGHVVTSLEWTRGEQKTLWRVNIPGATQYSFIINLRNSIFVLESFSALAAYTRFTYPSLCTGFVSLSSSDDTRYGTILKLASPWLPYAWSDCGFLYFKKGTVQLHNPSTLIAFTIKRLCGDLFKPLLAELGVKKDFFKKTRGASYTSTQTNMMSPWNDASLM